MEDSFNKCDHFFSLLLPLKRLYLNIKKITNINFIVGDFKEKNKKNNFKKCLIMDNGKRSLSTLINQTYLISKKLKI